MKIGHRMFSILFLVLALGLPFKGQSKDDCMAAYQIAYQEAFNDCMASNTDEKHCDSEARKQANFHMEAIGCPPIVD